VLYLPAFPPGLPALRAPAFQPWLPALRLPAFRPLAFRPPAFQPWPHAEPAGPLPWVPAVLLCSGLVLAVVGYSPAIRTRYWRIRFKPAAGRVVDHVGRDPVVEFEVAGSRVRFRGRRSGRGRGDPGSTWPVGSVVAVLYDPADPRQARLDEPGSPVHPAAWVALGAVTFTVGVLAAWL
jgi:hypothetical protein